jgi:small subunit ribosomal protein S5
VSAEDLWKGMTSVSNAGKKRGRGKEARRTMARDLNRVTFVEIKKKTLPES